MEQKNYGREAMEKSLDELVLWGIGTNDNPFRREDAKVAMARLAAAAQIETAKSAKWSAWLMLASVIVLTATGVVSALFQYLAWIYPHVPR